MLAPLGPAQEQETTSEILERISTETEKRQDWIWVVTQLKDPQLREQINLAIAERKHYPRQELVSLLTQSKLAIRLGALELLEQAAGTSYEFNPWAKPGEKSDATAIKAWRDWAGLTGPVNTAGPLLSDEQLQAYLRDIISGDSDRKGRAIRMLTPHSMKGVTAIQEFITSNAGIPRSKLLSLKEAQYHLVLNQRSSRNASLLARDLTRGNRDQQLSALSSLKKFGFLAIPIVRDFVESPDALVRETSIDTILSLGNTQAVPLVMPILEKEKDINVIHAAMRRLREIGGKNAIQIASRYLDHENEDMIVSSLQSLAKLKGKNRSFSSFPSQSNENKTVDETTQKIIDLLQDPRWRVRTAALEYIDETRTKEAGASVVKCLEDQDTFVRARAIEAVVALELKSAQQTLETLFLADDEMIAPITGALTSMSIILSDHLIAHLDTRSPDIIVGAVEALDSDKEPFLKHVARYATHANLDISCSALRALGDDSDKVAHEFVANHLTAALKSGVEEKVSSVLNTLRLPSPRSFSTNYYGSNVYVPPTEKTTLDALYDAFIPKTKPKAELSESQPPAASGGLSTLKATLAGIAKDWSKEPEKSFRAAYILGKVDLATGITPLLENYEKLTTSQRAAVADDFYSLKNEQAPLLIKRLMQDDLTTVRKDAAYSAFSDSKNQSMIQEAFTQLDLEDSKLRAKEVYGYGLERALAERSSQTLILTWARETLSSESIPEQTVLALAILREKLTAEDEQLITPYTRSKNQWFRRAAWYALANSRPSWVTENLSQLLEDPSPAVRLALPVALGNQKDVWHHQFNDVESASQNSYSSSNKRRKYLSEEMEKELRQLARKDPDARVRFESWFTLMDHRKTIDLTSFIQLISEQPKEARVARRLADNIERNYMRMGVGMRPLLAFAEVKRISKSKLPKILTHFADGGNAASFNSFAALAQSTDTTDAPQQVVGAATPEEIAERRQHLKVIVFYKPGCKQCEKAEKDLADLKENFPLMTMERHNILDQQGMLINRALCDRLQIGGAGKTPSFFTQAGSAISPNVKPETLATLLRDTMETEDDPSWADFEEAEIEEAKVAVEETFSKITLLIVILGGLFDGVNPCAFATIIFFLSYLQVAKRTPREILMVGISFITAIFLAYFSVGLIFHAAIAQLTQLESFQWARVVMTWVFAFFAFLVALLSLRDGIRASRGNLKDMTLQLPDFLKNRIRGTIRKRARARNYVIAAFVTGIIISFLELACTGQVYAPIVYQIQQGRADAVLYLLIYNIAFILPLVIIFTLAYRGMTSDALLKFQKNHTAAVKYATAALFFLLTIIILFGDRLLSHA